MAKDEDKGEDGQERKWLSGDGMIEILVEGISRTVTLRLGPKVLFELPGGAPAFETLRAAMNDAAPTVRGDPAV